MQGVFVGGQRKASSYKTISSIFILAYICFNLLNYVNRVSATILG